MLPWSVRKSNIFNHCFILGKRTEIRKGTVLLWRYKRMWKLLPILLVDELSGMALHCETSSLEGGRECWEWQLCIIIIWGCLKLVLWFPSPDSKYPSPNCLRRKDCRSPWLQSLVEISFLILNINLFFHLILYFWKDVSFSPIHWDL